MRMLGHKASVQTFRWDLVYLHAQLLADARAEVNALAPTVQGLLTAMRARRDALEDAEDAVVIASALLQRKDRGRDELVVEAGGVARAVDKAAYKVLFPKLNPSATARLTVDEESAEVSRILGELAKMPADHPVRQAYEQELTAAEAAVKAADAQSDAAETALALQRSQLDRFKLEVDQSRLAVHGQLLTLLKDKSEADAFFRPTTSAPSEATPSPAAPPAGTPPAGTP